MIFCYYSKYCNPQSDLKIVLNRAAYWAIINCDVLGIKDEHIRTECID